MPTVNPSLPSDGDDAVVAPYNSAIQAMLAVINGAIDQDNLAAGAVILSKLSSTVQQALIPSGTVLPYGGSSAPSGYLLCYGQAVSRTTYSDLFAAIGTSFGTGDGSTTFNLPDLRGRVPIGKANMGGTSASRIEVTSVTISTTSGSASASVSSGTNLAVGMYVFSTNVPAGTTITAISGTTVTLSANATATATGTSARFSYINDPETLGGVGGNASHAHNLSDNGAAEIGMSAASGSNTIFMRRILTTASWSVTQANSTSLAFGSGSGSQSVGAALTGNTDNGSTVQPSQVVNYIIKT